MLKISNLKTVKFSVTTWRESHIDRKLEIYFATGNLIFLKLSKPIQFGQNITSSTLQKNGYQLGDPERNDPFQDLPMNHSAFRFM